MIVCQNCRTQNTDDAARCVSCGESPTLAPRTLSTSSNTPDPAATATGFTYPLAEGGLPAPVAPAGTRIADRYELRALLGRGGMGLVYRARDLVLNEDTAIKLLQPHLMKEVGDIERLKREITTARKITHPNVIRIHDFGLAGEEGFISMEILSGGSLHERLAKGAIAIPEAVDIALGIAEGLGAAHAQSVIHRDIKPHNVLFDDKGSPKLADFGLARLATATSQTMGFSGTPQYMSPELADGREVTARSDVYSAGVLFYELLAGKPPFQADSLLRLATLHSKEAPPPLREKRPDVPPALEAIVMRALEKDPLRRFDDGRGLAAALRDFKSGATVQLPPLPARKRGALQVLAGIAFALFAACLVYEAATGQLFELLGLTPTPTPIAQITPTPTPTPAPTPTAEATPAPSATVIAAATPKPTPTKKPATPTAATPSPAATAIAVTAKPALLSVRSDPWGEVYLGRDPQHVEKVGKETTLFRDREFAPGRYWLRVRSPETGDEAGTWIELAAGERAFFSADLKTGVFTRIK